MSITAPKVYQGQVPARVFAGRRILDVTHKTLQQDQHYLYASSGARAPILVRATPFETASATNTQTDSSSAAVDLDRYQGCLRCTRPLSLSGDAYRLQARALVDDLEVTLRVYDVSTDTDLGTLVCDGRSNSAPTVEVDTLDLSAAEATDSGVPRVLLISIVGARFATKDAGAVGSLYGVEVLEIIADAADLP